MASSSLRRSDSAEAPRVPRNHCRDRRGSIRPVAPQECASAARFLDPRLPAVELAANSRLRRRARVRGRRAGGKHVTVIIESHGDFTDSPALLEILQKADSPNVALLWDAHHTFVSGKEQPEDTVRQLGRYIRHTHLKDSVPAGNDRRYVLTGTGDVPVKRQIAALAKIGYRGFFSFEWEKRWHPEIEEPEVAFAQYARVAREYLRDANVQ